MTARFNIATDAPALYETLLSLNEAIAGSGAEMRLVHLIKIRISQINGCAFCVNMHTAEALSDGVEQSVLNMLPVWREAKAFTPRERAALSWAETLTLLAGSGAPDEDFEIARKEFTEQELAALTIAIGTMNLWNRVGVGAKMTA